MKLFAEAGGTLIDTASKYTNGSAESIVGDLIAADRSTSWSAPSTRSASATAT